MHARLLLHLATMWSDMRQKSAAMTVMDFPVALKSTYRHLHAAVCATAQPWHISALMTTLERKPAGAQEAFDGGVCTMTFTFVWLLIARIACGALPMPSQAQHATAR